MLLAEVGHHSDTVGTKLRVSGLLESLFAICGRKTKSYTVEDAAEITEVSVETIRNMEYKRNDIRVGMLMILWDAYGLKRDGIMNYYVRKSTTDEIIKQIDKKYAQKRELKGII